jgi:transcriptional regulator GlxA family with amidase domain
MLRRKLLALSTGILLAAAAVGSAAVVTGSPPPRAASLAGPAPVPADEQARTIAAMRPPKRTRPVIAVIGQNEGTETTDFLVPYAVLAQSGAADVVALATEARAIRLTPALQIRPQATTAAFDARYPDGADYVIVPKIEDPDDPALVAFIQAQRAKGATIVGICSGVKTVAAAGLLDHRSGTGHWYDIEGLRKAHPTMRWVPNRRYVADRGVVTTTGVSASLPVSLALVEAIAGHERAQSLAAELGVPSWDAAHDSAAFRLDLATRRTAMRNKYAFWQRETYAVAVAPGVDEVALAFMADAWSRTFRSKALTVADGTGSVHTRHGLELLPDLVAGQEQDASMLPPLPSARAAEALPAALAGIASRYGDETASFVALQLEYLWRPNE